VLRQKNGYPSFDRQDGMDWQSITETVKFHKEIGARAEESIEDG
jgi:hypothetical protein